MESSSMADRWSTEEDYPRINFRGRNENLCIIRSNLKQCPAFAFPKISAELVDALLRRISVNFVEKGELAIAVRELRGEDERETENATGTREPTNENSS